MVVLNAICGDGIEGIGVDVYQRSRTFESTFGANNINYNTFSASSNSRRISLFFSIAPSAKKKSEFRAD